MEDQQTNDNLHSDNVYDETNSRIKVNKSGVRIVSIWTMGSDMDGYRI